MYLAANNMQYIQQKNRLRKKTIKPSWQEVNSVQFTRKRVHSGFTLIEIMVVVVIIGLLATLILPRVLGRQEEALIAKTKSDIRTMSSALMLYKLDNFKFPSTSDGLEILVTKTKKRGYIERLPNDPWGNSYQYLHPGEHLDFDIWSFGADARTGGSGVDADIGNWNLDSRK